MPSLDDLPQSTWAEMYKKQMLGQLLAQNQMPRPDSALSPDQFAAQLRSPAPMSAPVPRGSAANAIHQSQAPAVDPNFDPATLAQSKTSNPLMGMMGPRHTAERNADYGNITALLERQRQAGYPALQAEKQGIDDTAAQLKPLLESAQSRGEGDINLQPFLGAIDALTGSKMSQNYTPPESREERQKLALAAMNQLNTQKGAYAGHEEAQRDRELAARLKLLQLDSDKDMFGGQARAQVAMGNQASKVADTFDTAMKPYVTNAQNIKLGLDRLSAQPTMNTMNEVAQNFATALSQGKGSSNYKVSQIEIPTLEGAAKKFGIYLSSDPNAPAPQKLVEYYKTQGAGLLAGFKEGMSRQASGIAKGRESAFELNPLAKDVFNKKKEYYGNGGWLADLPEVKGAPKTPANPSGQGSKYQGMSDEDLAAAMKAKGLQ